MNNPFIDEYIRQEMENYGLENEFVFQKDSVLVKVYKSNVILIIDREPWASVSSSEIQSQFLPICYANGKIATAGLGLGYFVLKVMNKAKVKSIDVYESNRGVIDFFTSTFKDRENYYKVNIIKGDVKKKLKDQKYDFFYFDIYKNWYSKEIIEDSEYFLENSNIKQSYIWGTIEVLICACDYYKIISINELNEDERKFLKMYRDANLQRNIPSKEYCEDFLETLNRF